MNTRLKSVMGVLTALAFVGAASAPAFADDWHRHRHYHPRPHYYQPGYVYEAPPPVYYAPPPPPPPIYAAPGLNIVIPLGGGRHR